MPNKLQYTWCGDYCECVLPAQLSFFTEVLPASLLDQHPRYGLYRHRAGYNRYKLDVCIVSKCYDAARSLFLEIAA